MINIIKNSRVNLWIRNRFFIGILAFLHMGMFLTSCEENIADVLPAGDNIAYVNFVNAAEVFIYGVQENLQWSNYLYINDSINNPPFNNYNDNPNSYPFVFSYETKLDVCQCPRSFTSSDAVTTGGNADVYWLPVEEGNYRFIYTSKNKTYLKTTDMSLEKSTYQILYLVESPETDSSYTVVNVPIERKDRLEGTVSVQFVNLSPDAGEVEIYRVDAGGNEIEPVDTKGLGFGQYIQAEFSTEGTENTYNSILLRFRAAEGGDLVSFAIPANDGAVYTVLLRGFAQQTMRKIKKDNHSYAEVNIMPDLRASVRRVFY